MKYGLEYEFFIKELKSGVKIIPAYKILNSYHLDGCSVIGELRTSVCGSLKEAVNQLKDKIESLNKELKNRGYVISNINNHVFSNQEVKNFRKDDDFIDSLNQKEKLELFSIYDPKKIGKVLNVGEYKTSLQISFSDLQIKEYNYDNYTFDKKFVVKEKIKEKLKYSKIFNYVDIIRKFDQTFQKNISMSGRTKGVYAIKDDRIEYRSLPSNIDLQILSNIFEEKSNYYLKSNISNEEDD